MVAFLVGVRVSLRRHQAAMRWTLMECSNSCARERSNASCMPNRTSGVEPNPFYNR